MSRAGNDLVENINVNLIIYSMVTRPLFRKSRLYRSRIHYIKSRCEVKKDIDSYPFFAKLLLLKS